ncbi:hypothetical protein H310_10550 [Aphanomyces invadans]|uniref:Uncharacterized protein n=1 Tax=Aphanomyces invadans TaxID=157072 RepID=A0A024TSY6_9STRA|nr:hypothetical protein H310_10550 [Aphanomyces invadans]ETV96397.1 hypothetical protein H310_10550 [Aphanomyces invadans]|eukprot:XP_008875189.1 hypothetical protein H310_10550 [Aphanomyces invadans]
MTSSLQIKEVVAELDGQRSVAGELVVYHPVRDSFVSVTTTSLQEIDARTGVLVGEVLFDGSLLGDKPNAFECLVACGHKYVVAALSRFLVIWDLREMVLAHIAEVAVAGTMSQKTKHISALTASTDVVGTLFFAHEGSQSIRVVPVDALVQGRSTSMRKVLRKAATRNSAITALTYHTSHAVLGCGASDGSVQLWKLADTSELAAGRADAAAGEAELTHDVVAALNAKPAAVQSLVVHVTDSGALHVAITYVSRHIDVYRVQDRQLSPSTPIGSVGLPHGFTFAKKQAIAFGHVPNTLLVVLDDAATVGGAVLHLVRYGGPDDATRFGTPLDLYALGPNDPSAFVHVAVCGSHGSALYTSTATGRSVACLGYADDEPIDVASPTCRQWSTSMPLSFGQYCHPESIPDSFLQLAWSSDLNRYDVAKLSLKTNDRCPDVSFGTVPHTLENQLAMPLRLVASPDLARAGVLLETSSSVAVFVTSAESSATYDVADACFTLQGHLVTLVPSRKSVRWHDDVQSAEPHGASFPLPVAADRIFATRLPLDNTSDMCKILFVIRDAAHDTLRLSDRSLAFAADSPIMWTSHKTERVVDVQMEPSTGQLHNIAVLTTHRVVILDPSLVAVASYAPTNPLVMTPVSMLWIGSAIAFVTGGGGALYYLPTQKQATTVPALLCTLAKPAPSVAFSAIQLIAILPDRLVYTVQLPTSGTVATLTRPFSVVDVLAHSQDDFDVTRQYVMRELDCSPHISVSHRLVSVLGTHDPELCLRALSPPPSTTGNFRQTSHLSTAVVCNVLMTVHRWKDALLHAVVDDPGLQEYASDPVGASGAQLPQRLSGMSSQLSHFGRIMETFGQFSVAGQCYDVAGNDRALVELVLKCGEREALDALVNAIRPTNGPLAAALTGGTRPEIMPKHDPFRLLCNEHVTFERRSRLLPSVTSVLRQAKLQSPPAPTMPPLQWKYYSWRRLAPEEMGEWTGSTHVHYATEEFKPRKHAAATSAVAGKLSVDTQQSSFHDADNGGGAAGPLSTAAAAIGPFLEEEDGVVAYWRFEEGAAHATVTSGTQFVDTSKRENHITLQNLDLVVSTAPVDRGEEAKLQPEYALRFPSPSAGGCGHVVVKKGASTLDIGVSYDDDPYRRSLTVEMWIKPVETAAGAFTGTLMRRETPSPGDALWELAVDSGALAFTLLGQTVRTDKSAVKEATWQHVAAVVDVSSDDKATIRLAVGGAVAVTNDVRLPKAARSGDVSTLVVGPNLGGVEVTEIRIWATPRSAQQLHDMKENYLAMAESKKRIKMKIHNRDCQCDKCLGRRQHTPIAKLAMVQPLALTPTSRDRRQRMKTPKSEETRT